VIERVLAHFLSHPAGVIGLILNMVGAAMLVWCPPHIPYLPNGQWIGGTFTGGATEEGRRTYFRLKWGFRLAILLFVLGFALQLGDLLLA